MSSKTVFVDGNPSLGVMGTVVNAAFLNSIFQHRHDGLNQDGSAPIDYVADTGAVNAYVATLTPALTAPVGGMPIRILVASTNTGASTLTVNGLSPAPIVRSDLSALQPRDMVAGGIATLVWDGTYYQLLGVDPRSPTQAGIQSCLYVYAADSTNTNTYAASVTPAVTSLSAPLWVLLKVTNTNTSAAAATLALNGLAAVPITDRAGKAVRPGAMQGLSLLFYDGVNFELHSAFTHALGGVIGSSAAQSVGAADSGMTYVATGAFTATIAQTTTLSPNHVNIFSAVGGAITIAVNGADAVNGGSAGVGTTIPQGTVGILTTNGAGNLDIVIPASVNTPVPTGATRNLVWFVATAAVNPANPITADEIIVKTALGGATKILTSFSQSINLGAIGTPNIGANGLDNGVLTVGGSGYAGSGGYVALYAGWNPTANTTTVWAQNAYSSIMPEIYAGGHAPAGFTYSALIGVYPVNSSGYFVAGLLLDRAFYGGPITTISGGTALSYTSVSFAAAIPKNAKSYGGIISASYTTASSTNLAANVNGLRAVQVNSSLGGTISAPFQQMAIIPGSEQVAYYFVQTSGTTAVVNISNYTI